MCLQETWWALLLLISLPGVQTFYVPGVAPQDFHEGDKVEIKVRKFTPLRFSQLLRLQMVLFVSRSNHVVCVLRLLCFYIPGGEADQLSYAASI